jgi:hypothetical protein
MSEAASILDIIIRMRTEGKPDAEISASLQKMGVAADDVNAAIQKLSQSNNSLADAMGKLREKSEAAAQSRRTEIEDAQLHAIAISAEVKGLQQLSEAKRASAEAARQPSLADLMGGFREQSERGAAGRRAEMENAQAMAVSMAAQARGTAALKAAAEAGNKIGEEAGKHATDSFGKNFGLSPVVMEHIGTIIGKQFGMTGLGTAFLSGGFVGTGLALGLNLIHAAVEAMSEDDKVLEELNEQLKEIEKHSGPGHGANLTADDLKKLAAVMAGDAKAASKAWTDAMAGNFTTVHALGIATTATKTRTEQLGEALQTLRTDGASDLYELGNAAINAAAEIAAIKTAAEDAQKAIEKTSAAIDRAAATRERAAGNEQGADLAEIEARVAEGGISRAEADKKIASIKQAGLARSHINAQDDRRQKIAAANEGVEEIQSTFADQAKDTGERERIIQLLSELQRRTALTKEIQQKIDAIVSASFGPGKTEDEYKKFLATLPAGQSAEMLGTLGGLDKHLAQAKVEEGSIREQLPAGRDNLNAEVQWMNENGPKIRKEQEAAYRRMIDLMDKINSLESEMRAADAEFGQKIRQSTAEGRAKDATNQKAEPGKSTDGNQFPPKPATIDRSLYREFGPSIPPGKPSPLPPARSQQEQVERDEATAAAAANRARWGQEDAEAKAKQEADRQAREEREAIERDPARARRVRSSPIAQVDGDSGDVSSAIEENTGAVNGLGKSVINGMQQQNRMIQELQSQIDALAGAARTALMTA